MSKTTVIRARVGIPDCTLRVRRTRTRRKGHRTRRRRSRHPHRSTSVVGVVVVLKGRRRIRRTVESFTNRLVAPMSVGAVELCRCGIRGTKKGDSRTERRSELRRRRRNSDRSRRGRSGKNNGSRLAVFVVVAVGDIEPCSEGDRRARRRRWRRRRLRKGPTRHEDRGAGW